MARYVDGFVITIKKKNLKLYKKMAALGRKIWMDHGALSYYECMADDYIKWGLGFKKLCKVKPGEIVMFAFIVYKSKAERDRINKKVHSDPRMNAAGTAMPFEAKRFAMAGFKAFVHSK